MVDDEHKTLFNGILNLSRDYCHDNMNELTRVTGKHFKDEEVVYSDLVIVAVSIEYSCLSLCVCLSVCVSVCLCTR